MSIATDWNAPLGGIAVEAIFAFLMANFRRVPENLSQSCKLHLSCAASSIGVALICTYAFPADAPPMLDNGTDIEGLVVVT